MNIYLSRHSGFCFGVNRALNKIDSIKDGIYVFGRLIHNQQVVNELEQKGVKITEEIEQVRDRVAITAHGVADSVINKLKKKNVKIIDTTCPYVRKVHAITKDLEKKGYKILILGDKNHPEVKGIAGNLNNCLVINSYEDITRINDDKKVALVAQTTQDLEKFKDIADKLRGKIKHLKVLNTICDATIERQISAKEIAKKVDLMIVIGGFESANTKRLHDICNKMTESKLIETAKGLRKEWFKGKKKVGVTAGASTPDKIITEVIERIKRFGKEMPENLI